MVRKYRVFIRDGAIAFYDGGAQQVASGQQVVENPKKDALRGIIEGLEEGMTTTEVHVVGDAEKNWKRFVKQFTVIEAAGGVVLNEADDWLFIHRLGRWDLPKGKLEKGEKPKQAATREVSEECGIPEPGHRGAYHRLLPRLSAERQAHIETHVLVSDALHPPCGARCAGRGGHHGCAVGEQVSGGGGGCGFVWVDQAGD
jgi:hypothetical protein